MTEITILAIVDLVLLGAFALLAWDFINIKKQLHNMNKKFIKKQDKLVEVYSKKITHTEYQDILKEVYKIAVEEAVVWLENQLDRLQTEDGKPMVFNNKKDFIKAFKKAMSNE